MNKKIQPAQLSFQVNGLQFSAQAWGDPTHMPVLSLHGWLDNSSSFFALAPQLKDVYLVALDLAGHGQTNHRLGFAPYNIWEDVVEIFAVAEQLGWQKFALLGHSRGGIIAALAAGTFPDRITHLGLIEGLLPEPTRSEDAPKQLALSIKGVQTQIAKPLSLYKDIASAISSRERGMFPLSYEAAKALTERGVKKVKGGFHWSTDQRLLAPSAIKLLPEQISAFITRISAPIQLILAQDGIPKLYPAYQTIVAQYPNIAVETLAGGHHLHMEQEVAAVAAIFNRFFETRSE